MRFALLAATLLAGTAQAQTSTPAPVDYLVRLDDAVHHRARITVTWRDLPAGPVRVRMARSSPGRYAIHEFAKNVYDVTAIDSAGRAIALSRTDPYGWTVPAHDGTVSVTYTLFGDLADGTYAQIDASHAHLNAPATFLFAEGQDARGARVRFTGHDPSWQVATQLKPDADGSWSAPSFQYLMDSPIEVSAHKLRQWTLPDAGGTIRIAFHADVTDAEADEFGAKARRIVAAQVAIFGEPAKYDFGTYTFLADYLPWVSGDGMEHRNSTVISGSGKPSLSTLSHEFFHSWNVERLRPRELEPFDFTRANPTPSLWFAEGFTNYYGPLAIRRAGVGTLAEWVRGTSGTLDFVLNNPAREHGGPQEMSLRAPFADAAVSIDPAAPHVFLSYYPYGQVIALALDLSLRQRFRGVTLDDLMRHLWRTHGRTERPYSTDDLRLALGVVTKDQAFADAFFAETIAASRLPDLVPLLAQAGLVLRRAAPDSAWIGDSPFADSAEGVIVAGYPAPGTPLHRAGLDKGDRILAVDGTPATNAGALAARVAALSPGGTIRLRATGRGVEREATITVAANPRLELVTVEATGAKPTAQQRRFRASWLGRD